MPFVGRAGKKLDRLLQETEIQEAYILNAAACRPPNNRNPEPDELKACLGRLQRQVAALAPRVMVTLGGIPTLWLLGEDLDGALRPYVGQVYRLKIAGLEPLVVVTYHPAFLLRKKQYTGEVRDHLRLAKALLEV